EREQRMDEKTSDNQRKNSEESRAFFDPESVDDPGDQQQLKAEEEIGRDRDPSDVRAPIRHPERAQSSDRRLHFAQRIHYRREREEGCLGAQQNSKASAAPGRAMTDQVCDSPT